MIDVFRMTNNIEYVDFNDKAQEKEDLFQQMEEEFEVRPNTEVLQFEPLEL